MAACPGNGLVRKGRIMFEIGDYVVKTVEGVCRIADRLTISSGPEDAGRLYYLMVPVKDSQSKIYVPVREDYSDIRPIIGEREAEQLIRDAAKIREPGITDDKDREKTYKEAIRSCDPRRLMGIIKCMRNRKLERIRQGKKSTTLDERYFRMAENALLSELSYVLKLSSEEVRDRILRSAGEAED